MTNLVIGCFIILNRKSDLTFAGNFTIDSGPGGNLFFKQRIASFPLKRTS